MTVTVETPYSEHTANGVTTVFAYEFRILESAHLVVTVDGETIPDSDYTVSGVGDVGGGDVTFDTAPDDLAAVILRRVIPYARTTSYATNGTFPASTVNTDFDTLWMALQGFVATLEGAIRLPFPEAADELPAPAARADRALVFNASTGLPEVSSFTQTQVASAIAAAYSGAAGPLDDLSFLQAGTGAGSRSAQDKDREWVSIGDFENSPGVLAALDGVTDDTVAVQACFTYAAANRKAVFLPGRCAITDPITTLSEFAPSIFGLGPAVSRFIYKTVDASITLETTSATSGFEGTFFNVGFCADAEDITFALKLKAVKPGAGRKPVGPQFDHCYFGYDSQGGDPIVGSVNRCFAKAVHLDTIRDSTFISTMFYGKRPNRVGNAVYMEGECTSGPTFMGCEFFHWDKAVTKSSSGVVSGEGLRFSSCIFVTNNWGVHCESPIAVTDPAVVFKGCHFNNEEGAIWLKRSGYISVADCFFIANTASTTYIDVYVEDARGFSAHDNSYANAAAAATAKGIVLVDVVGIDVHNEYFSGACRVTALQLDAACEDAKWRDNDWGGIAVPVVNNIPDRQEYVRKSFRAPGYVIAHTPTAQSLATGAATAIVWQDANVSETYAGAWVVGNPSRFVVPSDVTLVRLAGNLSFVANATGVRILAIRKNGSNFAGMAYMRMNAAASGDHVMNVSTGLLEVVAGDYFELEATQTSGGALNTTSSTMTSFTMELVG